MDSKTPNVTHNLMDKKDEMTKATTLQEQKTSASNGTAASPVSSSHPILPMQYGLSTNSFLRLVKSIAGTSGHELTKTFLCYWILESSIPFFTAGYWYNRKQTQAEIVLQQETPPGGQLYGGLIPITVIEDTSEYTYYKRIENRRHKWDLPCHSKVRKKRRKRQGLTDPDDSISVTGPGMGLNDTPVYWVKLNPNYSWLCHVIFHQPDFNYMEQLLSDKSLISKILAIRSLAIFPRSHEKPNIMSCRVITECMSGLTSHIGYLRKEAAISLANWQSIHAPEDATDTKQPIWKGLHNLLRIYKEHFFTAAEDMPVVLHNKTSSRRITSMPLPNYFLPSGGKVTIEALGEEENDDLSGKIEVTEYAAGEYEIRKSIPYALSLLHSKDGQSPKEIEEFLLVLLTQNDNTKNYLSLKNKEEVVDDCFFLGNIIISLSLLNIASNYTPNFLKNPTSASSNDPAIREILRYFYYDFICPSHQYILAACCIEALCNLVIKSRCSSVVIPFHEYAHPRYEKYVRQAAIESIIRLYFNEDFIEKKDHKDFKGEEYEGLIAALEWTAEFIAIEKSTFMRLFAIQAFMDLSRNLPPRTSSEILASVQPAYAYTTKIRHSIVSKFPLMFTSQCPITNKYKIMEMFPLTLKCISRFLVESPSLSKVIHLLWYILNEETKYNQKLRIAVLNLYRTLFGDDTPLSIQNDVQKKIPGWAGGFEGIREFMESFAPSSKHDATRTNSSQATSETDRRNAMKNNDNNKSLNSNGNGDREKVKTTSTPTITITAQTPSLVHLKGKKLKLKLGEALVRSHKL